MGWWKIDSIENGCVSETLPTGHPGRKAQTICNAVPGRDAPEDLYNGDGPADILDAAVKQVEAEYERAWKRRVQPDELRAAFNFVFNGWRRRVHTPLGLASAG